jgi:hypothetical protein
MKTTRWVLVAAIIGAALVALFVYRARATPRLSLSAERAAEGETNEAPSPAGAPAAGASRALQRLAAENFALLQERAALRKALAAAEAPPVVPGLPTAPPAIYTPEESRLLDDIFQRAVAGIAPRVDALYREVMKAPPPPGSSTTALCAALLDSTGITEGRPLADAITAMEKIKAQNGSLAADASLIERVIWLLSEAGDVVEREVKDALPPARYEELRSLPKSGFGYSVSLTNGRWVVDQARPHS